MFIAQIVHPHFQPAFGKLLKATFPGKIMLRLKKLERELSQHVEDFNRAKNQLLMTFCDKDENGEPIRPTPETVSITQNLDLLNKSIEDMGKEEVAKDFVKIPWEDFDKIIDQAKITTEDLAVLDGLYEEPA